MIHPNSRWLSVSVAALLAACSSGGGSGTSPSSVSSTAQRASVPLMLSDASTEDWATIGVKVLSVALVPQGGGGNVVIYTAPTPAPMVNLVQLDQLAEILGNVSVPVGAYTGAVLTVSANPADLLLTVAADPEAGFAAPAGTTIATSQIQVQHTQGTGTNLTVPIDLTFESPLTVSTSQSSALDVEFDLGHPAFILAHVPAGSGDTIWSVNFQGPVHQHPLHELSRLVLRQTYGVVDAIAADSQSVTLSREFPTEPAVSPETAVAGGQSLQILADAVNGTLFYDVDAKTQTVIHDFSSQTALTGKNVRVAARFQQNGTLVATRIWASSQFNSVWFSPEGHVLHVYKNGVELAVTDESGSAVDVTINANTQFYFRQPQNAVADGTPIGSGTGFITGHGLVRGFKIHANVVDPLATPLVAQSVDIETAKYDGVISAGGATGFTDTQTFRTAADDYAVTLDYIAPTTANGTDDAGNAISGFKWWNFAHPTVLESGANAIAGFMAATGGSVDFGGSLGAVPARGTSFAIWGDPANASGWSVATTVVDPSLLPLGAVATPLTGNTFTMTATGGNLPVTVDVDTASGSATLSYRVDRTNGIVTVTPIDVTTSDGLATLTNCLAAGAPVRVYGVPQGDGTLRAYVIACFTGVKPVL